MRDDRTRLIGTLSVSDGLVFFGRLGRLRLIMSYCYRPIRASQELLWIGKFKTIQCLNLPKEAVVKFRLLIALLATTASAPASVPDCLMNELADYVLAGLIGHLYEINPIW